jgi:hypothetical protein
MNNSRRGFVCPDVNLDATGHAEAVTINGLPLHPLVVHATVVGLPALAVLAVLHVVRPGLQDRLRLPLMGLALVAAALVFLTVRTGKSLQAQLALPASFVQAHHLWATRLEWTTFGFAALLVVMGLVDQRAGWVRPLVHALVVVGAVAIVWLCVMTGEAGARMVYPTT